MQMSQPSDFGRALRELREARQITQTEVADALGINPTFISNLERGYAHGLSPRHFKALCQVLRLTAKDLVRLRRARLMTMLDRLLEPELASQPIHRMKAIIAVSRPGKRQRI